jgi:murein DD-endopeptidase MepM/ murein hydrolase activator NlpD
MTQIRWDLLGAPVDVGAAVRGGYQVGRAFRQQQRQDDFQQSALAAYDPATGNVNAPAMRSAFVQAGNVEGAMQFDQSQITRDNARREQSDVARARLARLATQANAQNWPQTRAAAIELGVPAANIPEAFDPTWLERQRAVLTALDDPQERTSFQRDLEAAGYDLSTETGRRAARRFIEQRYAAPPRIITGPNNQLMVVGGGGETPPELTDEEVARDRQGGPQASSPAGGFSVISAPGAPRDGGARTHMGYDMRNPTNPAWVAPMGFEVRNIRNGARQGITADVIFEDGTRVVGMHFREPPQVRRGRPGEIIGYQGNTGNARTTPAHIHAEAWRDGQRIDPTPYFRGP